MEDVEKTIQRYENRAEELAEQYNEWYLNKCQIAAYIVEHNDKLVNKDKLAELADILQIYNIFVFDKNGTVEATNSSFNNFTLSQDPEDQSYEFNKLLMGVDYLIQEAQPDEVSEEFYQYIGVEEEDDRMINVVLPDGRVKQTESAASRWMSIALKWDEKTPEQQIATVVKFLIGILAVAICLGVVFREAIFQKDSIFNYIVDGGWEKGVNIFAVTASIMIIAVVMTGTEIVKRILKLLASVFGARGETVCRLISSFIKYVAIVAMLYYCFALFGVDTATLLASAGILSIAISLGAKDMVGDILAGLFIIFEGEFRVGDIVMIGDWRGTVLEIGVRTTKIEDGSKNIKIIRNSNVTDVINMTKRSSYAFCDDYLKPELPQTMSCTVKSALNIHSGAGADTPVIGTLKHGDKIKVSADENDWLRFTMEDGTIGYVWDEYMAVVE